MGVQSHAVKTALNNRIELLEKYTCTFTSEDIYENIHSYFKIHNKLDIYLIVIINGQMRPTNIFWKDCNVKRCNKVDEGIEVISEVEHEETLEIDHRSYNIFTNNIKSPHFNNFC